MTLAAPRGYSLFGLEGVRRVDVLGTPFDAISYEETIAAARRAVAEKRRIQLCAGSVDFVMKARKDPVFQQELHRADLVFADGQFIVFAAAALGEPLRGRVSGTEFVWDMGRVSADTGAPVALVGAAPGVADRAAAKMRERFPGAVLHTFPTPPRLGPEDSAKIAAEVRDKGCAIVLIALGAPRQERWIAANLEACGSNVGIGIGSAFDIICGDKPRAPMWMQKMSLEWFFRMMLEPKRLGRRYLIEDMPFVALLAKEVARRRLAPPRRAE